MAPSEAERRTGGAAAGLTGQTPDLRPQTDLFMPMAAQIARTFSSPRRVTGAVGGSAKTGPLLALLSTPQDTEADWLIAGQALQTVLLRATAANVSASCLSPPLEVGELRRSVGDVFHAQGHSQVLLQLGYAAAVPPTARRSVAEVLD